MGEANFYLKAWFPSKQHLRRVLPAITRFVAEGTKAHNYWQTNRGETPEKFWPTFQKNFPVVSEYLDTIQPPDSDKGRYRISAVGKKSPTLGPCKSRTLLGGDCDHALLGNLDFGGEDDIGEYESGVLGYMALTWSHADWDPLVNFLKIKWGAVKGDWTSDENPDLFEV